MRSVYIFQVSGIQVMGREAPSRGVQVFSGSKRQLARLGMDIELARSIGQRSIDYPRRPAVSSQLPVLHPVWLTVTSGCDLVKLVPFVVGRHLESAPSTALCHSSDSSPPSPPSYAPIDSVSRMLSRLRCSSLGQEHCQRCSRTRVTLMRCSATCSPHSRDSGLVGSSSSVSLFR